jgi:hypothetical protein
MSKAPTSERTAMMHMNHHDMSNMMDMSDLDADANCCIHDCQCDMASCMTLALIPQILSPSISVGTAHKFSFQPFFDDSNYLSRHLRPPIV